MGSPPQGRVLLQGFRNRNVREELFPRDQPDPARRRRASGRVTRLLRLLRAHGLIKRVSHTSYYRVTRKDQDVMSTALALPANDLARLAA